MKKTIAILLTFLLVFAVCGCKGNETGQETKTDADTSAFTANIDKAWKENNVDEYRIATGNTKEVLDAARAKMMKNYGENKEITGEYDESLAAKTVSGVYVGKKDDNGIVSWKGVPFAKQPVGELRWKAPQAPDPSDKVHEAYYFGHSALQMESFDEVSGLYPQGEDCLNLNVWNNPADPSESKPIMVWIHGGAYVLGGSVDPEYDGTNIVKNNPEVIYVSIDYRTGIMGFINLSQVPGGEAYKESANLGLLDEVQALTWLKENAKAFGGDPERITIFGESAGGGSVSSLTIMPKAKGLFKRAIIQSGCSSYLLRTAEKSIGQTKQILDLTGAENMDDLLSLTESDLRKISHIMLNDSTKYTYPQCDGITLPMNIKEALSSDQRDGIEILRGTNKNEFNYWTFCLGKEVNYASIKSAYENFTTLLNEDEKVRLDKFMNDMDCDEYDKLLQFVNYMSFHSPDRFEAKTHAERGQSTYVYFFTEESCDPDLLAYHAFELGYVFDNLLPEYVKDMEEAKKLSRVMQKMWINFALTGDPGIREGDLDGVGAIPWEKYDANEQKVMIINSEKCGMATDPVKDNVDLIGDLFWARFRQ